MRSNLHHFGMSQHDTVLLWFPVFCILYGSFRVHEIFPHKKTEYDPCQTLLMKDVVLKFVRFNDAPVEVLMITTKSPKEAKGSSPNLVQYLLINSWYVFGAMERIGQFH